MNNENNQDLLAKKVELHKQVCKQLNETYLKKNHDYNDAFSKRFNKRGMIYVIDKLQEKLDRIEALDAGVGLVAGESMEDSLLDLANYAIMTLVEERAKSVGGISLAHT